MNNISMPNHADLLTQARIALDQRAYQRAGECAARVLQGTPNHADAHHLLGMAAIGLGRIERALEHLHHATVLEPRSAIYKIQLARALTMAFRSNEALQVANLAASLPADPAALAMLGAIYGQCNAHERAVAAFRRALERSPDDGICRFNYAISLSFLGDVAQAEAELEASLALVPANWLAHGVLSRLRRQTPASNHIERLTRLAEQTRDDPAAQAQLHMALGKEYEDLEDYARAFGHFSQGNAAARGGRRYDVQADQARVDALIRAFPEGRSPPAGCATEEPIFIVGLPRSGTTLVERIISNHGEVYSAGELLNFGVALERLVGGNLGHMLSPSVAERVAGIDWEQLGLSYLASTRPLTCAKPRFIDKFPHNFFYLGHIASALPHARIVCLRRDPMDTCLSNFREPFAETSPFHGYSFDLLDAGRHYLLFDRLMAHWKRVLPGRILEVQYETLVGNPESESRRLLAHCGLPWDPGCLHFEQNRAAAATASSTQVRSPIYQSALQRWKKYGSNLDPLRQLLSDNGIAIDP